MALSQEKLEKALKTQNFSVLHRFKVMYTDWDSDTEVAIVVANGKRQVVMTTHGWPYVASMRELTGFLSEYAKATRELCRAIELLNEEAL